MFWLYCGRFLSLVFWLLSPCWCFIRSLYVFRQLTSHEPKLRVAGTVPVLHLAIAEPPGLSDRSEGKYV